MTNDSIAQLSSAEQPKEEVTSAETDAKEENKAVRKEASGPGEESTREPSARKVANGEAKRCMLPPPVRKAPVPKLSADTNPSASKTSMEPAETVEEAAAKRAKAAALASVSRAGRNVTPAERERAIAEAAAAAAAAYAVSKSDSATANRGPEASTSATAAGNGQPGDASRQAVSYSEPEWGGMPSRQDFSLETMKGGQIIGEKSLDGKSCFTFGRAATCDFVMEHPSISRLHAVLQFGAGESAPSIYDCGSTHGTYLNKGRLKPKTYAPLSVGDMIKFGQSSRRFILGGPSELMPEEGLSKAQQRQLAALEAKEKRRMREEEIAKAQMAAALNRGISWGMGEDATVDDDDDNGVPSVEWRAYAQTHTLTDNQQKLADKLRRLENRIRNLTTEADRIRAKQGSMEDLTAGQAAQLARNEQIIDKASEEFEDLEEMLNESIAESLRGKRGKLEAEASKKRRTRDDEGADSGSEEDEFYDRTAPGKSKKRKAAVVVHDAASLFGRKEALLEEKQKVEAQLAEELAADAAADSATSSRGGPQAAADPLDAFMSGVTVELEQSKIDKLRKDVAEIAGEIEKMEALLKHADPDGYYREGTHAAKVAREKGLRLFNQDKERKTALEKKKRQEAAKTAAEQKAARLFVPETEEEEEAPLPQKLATEKAAAAEKAALGMVHRLEAPSAEAGGLEIRKATEAEKPRPTAAFSPLQRKQPPTPEAGLRVPEAQGPSTKEQRDAMIKAALAKEEAAKSKAQKGGVPQGQDALLADLALLKKAAAGTDEVEVEGEAAAWKPPTGQSGDGRIALNQKLGY